MRTTRTTILAAIVTALFTLNASALRFAHASYFVPKGVVGKPDSHVFELAKGGGCPPYHYIIANNEKLPPGLTLSQDDGKVTGTPLAPGKWSIWLHGIDSGLQQGVWNMRTERQFTFEILPALNIREQSLEPTVRNQPSRVKFSAEGGGTQAWSVLSGALQSVGTGAWKHEDPRTKNQRSSTVQTPKSSMRGRTIVGAGELKARWCLAFGVRCLSGAWSLELGVFSPHVH